MKIRKVGWMGIAVCALLWTAAFPAQAGEGYFYEKGTIWRAAQDGNLAGVKRMLGAQPSLLRQRDKWFKDTVLEAAAHGGKAPVFKYVLGRGAPLTKDQIMLHAAAGGNLEIIRFVAARGAKINARRADSGDTPIMWAAQDHGKLEVLKVLVSRGADVKAKSKSGYTALIYAGFPGASSSGMHYRPKPKNKLLVIQYLIARGANVNAQTKYGTTCLSNAVTPDYPRTPAACAASEKLTQFLLSKGANPNLARDYDGDPVLNRVANSRISQAGTPHELQSGLRVLSLLLQHKANPNLQNKKGEAALHQLLTYYGSGYGPKDSTAETQAVTQAARLLLNAGAKPELKDKNGKSPRDMVREEKGRRALAPLFGIKIEPAPRTPTPTLKPAPQPTPAPRVSLPPAFTLKAGEIAIAGAYHSKYNWKKEQNQVEISAFHFFLPGGKGKRIQPSKPKLIALTPETFIHWKGDTGRLTMEEIAGTVASWTVIGDDSGPDQPLTAREIIVARTP